MIAEWNPVWILTSIFKIRLPARKEHLFSFSHGSVGSLEWFKWTNIVALVVAYCWLLSFWWMSSEHRLKPKTKFYALISKASLPLFICNGVVWKLFSLNISILSLYSDSSWGAGVVWKIGFFSFIVGILNYLFTGHSKLLKNCHLIDFYSKSHPVWSC